MLVDLEFRCVAFVREMRRFFVDGELVSVSDDSVLVFTQCVPCDVESNHINLELTLKGTEWRINCWDQVLEVESPLALSFFELCIHVL